MMCPEAWVTTGSALRFAAVVLVEKSLGLHRQMHLVLERRVAAGREQSGVIGDCFAERGNPGLVVLGEVGQHMAMHQLLDAGVADPEPHPPILVAHMRADRTHP